MKRAVFGLLSLVPAAVLAAPTCEIDLSKPKFYHLELTVPATFCAQAPYDPSCKQFPKKSLIQLHGLWPNYSRGYPEGSCSPSECRELSGAQGKYCGYPNLPDLYASKPWNDLKSYMAGTEKCLERHEWVKHGTCSPLSATQYFDWGLRKTKEISDKLALPADRPIGKAEFERQVAARLPDLNGAFKLSCKGNRLGSVSVLYTWTAEGPGSPMKNPAGKNIIACPGQFIVPSRPN